jgi:hypothetical protein
MHTERITYLASADHKAALEAVARERGESVGSVLREAAARYIGQPTEDEEAELVALTQQVNEAVPRMAAAMDRMIERMDRTHRKVDALLRDKGYRK